MKIVYFANASVPSRTANSVHIMKMCEALGSQGHGVTLVVPNLGVPEFKGADPFAFYGVARTFRLLKTQWMRRTPTGLYDIAYVLMWACWLRLKIRSDLCITRNLWAGLIFPIFGIRTILELHSPISDTSRLAALWRRADTFRNRNFVKLVVISNSLREYFESYGVPTEKIAVLPDAVDVRPFLNLHTSIPDQSLGSALAIGYVGSLNEGKGMEIIIELAKRDSRNIYHVYGGSPEDVSRWNSAAGHQKNMRLYGHIPNAQVPEVIASLDVMLMPYLRKVSVSGNYGDVAAWMSPLKMFEYMAAGKPIVSSDLPVLREILKHGDNALLVDPDHLDQWLTAIRRLEDEPELRVRLGAAARAEVLEHYTWSQRSRRILL